MAGTRNAPRPWAERMAVPLALVAGLAIIVFSVPFSGIWHLQGQIDATASQVAQLKAQTQAAASSAQSLKSGTLAIQMARQQYQLVNPGQSLIQVLPGASRDANAAHQGDPGFDPLVSPASVSPLADPSTTATPVHPTGFLERLVRTLEFWR